MLLVHPTRNSGGVSIAGSPRTKEQVSPRCSKRRLSTIASNGPKCDSLLGPATSGGPRSILALSHRLAQAAVLRSTSEGRCPLQTPRGDADASNFRGWLHANHAAGDKPRPLYLRQMNLDLSGSSLTGRFIKKMRKEPMKNIIK